VKAGGLGPGKAAEVAEALENWFQTGYLTFQRSTLGLRSARHPMPFSRSIITAAWGSPGPLRGVTRDKGGVGYPTGLEMAGK
jgi:hypothetical protein